MKHVWTFLLVPNSCCWRNRWIWRTCSRIPCLRTRDPIGRQVGSSQKKVESITLHPGFGPIDYETCLTDCARLFFLTFSSTEVCVDLDGQTRNQKMIRQGNNVPATRGPIDNVHWSMNKAHFEISRACWMSMVKWALLHFFHQQDRKRVMTCGKSNQERHAADYFDFITTATTADRKTLTISGMCSGYCQCTEQLLTPFDTIIGRNNMRDQNAMRGNQGWRANCDREKNDLMWGFWWRTLPQIKNWKE